MNSIVAALSKADILSVPWKVGRCMLALAMDTGACANLLSYRSYLQMKDQMPFTNWQMSAPDAVLQGLSGTPLNVLGKVTLKLKLTNHPFPFVADFHVVDSFPLPCDGLLGLDMMSDHGISVCPNSRTIKVGQTSYSALHKSYSLLTPLTAPVMQVKHCVMGSKLVGCRWVSLMLL